MQRMSWKKPLIVIVVLVALAFGVQHFRAGKNAAADHHAVVPSVPVKVAEAKRGDLDLSLKVIGRAEAFSTVNVQARVAGQLQTLLFAPGGHVNQGSTIIRIDPSLLQAQLNGALGNLAKDEAQLINAQAVLKRYVPLLPKGYVSQADYDTYKANVGIYEASVKADKAAVDLARTQLSYAQIQAPFESIAGAPLVYPGAQIVANMTTIVVLNQIRPIHITFSIPETSLAGIKAATGRGAVPVAAKIPGATTPPLQAAVDFINNAVDTTTGTIQVKARYENDDDRLTPGQFVEVTLPTARLPDVVTVPVVALQNSPLGSFVFVVDGDGNVQQRIITVGASSGEQVVVSKGLNGGERVVTDGQMLLINGSHVRIVTSNS